jgi:hypothetical protein
MVCSRHDSRVAAVGPDKRPSPERTATDKVAPIADSRHSTHDGGAATQGGRASTAPSERAGQGRLAPAATVNTIVQKAYAKRTVG